MWVGNVVAVHVIHVGKVSAWGKRARVTIGGDVVYVYIRTRVVLAVCRTYYACTVTHTCSVRIRAVVSNYGPSALIVYSTRHAVAGRYCTGTCVRGVSPKG